MGGGGGPEGPAGAIVLFIKRKIWLGRDSLFTNPPALFGTVFGAVHFFRGGGGGGGGPPIYSFFLFAGL